MLLLKMPLKVVIADLFVWVTEHARTVPFRMLWLSVVMLSVMGLHVHAQVTTVSHIITA